MASYQFNPINILDTSNATSLTDGGSMTLGGGISIGKDTLIGGNVSISGTTTSFSDNILLVNKNPSISTDTGIIFQRYTSDIENNKNYAGIIYSEQNDSFNLGYLVSDADRNYVSIGSLIPLNVKDITTGNVNFTGNLYKNGTLYNPSQWTTSNNDIYYTTGNVITNNLIATNISGSNLRLSGDLYVGGTLSTVNVTTTNVMDINITTGTINVTGISNLNNATATNSSVGVLIASTGITTASILNTGLISSANLASTTATIPNIINTNISAGTINASTGITAGSAKITNANITTATVGTLRVAGTSYITNAEITSVTAANIVVPGFINTQTNTINTTTIQPNNIGVLKDSGIHYWSNINNISDTTYVNWGPVFDEYNVNQVKGISNISGGDLSVQIRITGTAENGDSNNDLTGTFYIANSSGNLISTIYEYTVDNATSGGPPFFDPTPGSLAIDTGYITVTIPQGGLIQSKDNGVNDSTYLRILNPYVYINVVDLQTNIPRIISTNTTVTNITSGSAKIINATVGSANITSATVSTLLNTNIVSTNVSAASFNASGLSILSNVTATNTSVGGLNASGLSILSNATATNVSTGGLNASGLSVLANVTATNASVGVLIASTGITTSSILNTGLISSANLASTTATLPNIVSTNISAGTINVSTGITTESLLNTGLVQAGSLSVSGSSTFNGIPSGPTAISGTNTNQLATTAFVKNEISDNSNSSSIINSSNVIPTIVIPVTGLTKIKQTANVSSTLTTIIKTSDIDAQLDNFTNRSQTYTFGPSIPVQFVAVGSGTNTIAYSNDSLTWTGIGATIFSSGGNDVTWNGTRWVAVGQGTNTIAYSNDGITWTGIGTSIFSTQGIGISWNGILFVAVGEGTNTIAYSSDGINWTGLAAGPFTLGASLGGRGIAWNGTRFVAVGAGTNTIAYSSDGITWTGAGSTFTTAGNGIAWNGLRWVAVGLGTNTIAFSNDNGNTWTGKGASIFTSTAYGVAWNGIRWVAVGAGTNTIAYSSDGNTWTGLGATMFSSQGDCVSWTGTRWIAGGEGTNTIAYSNDGILWTGLGITTPASPFTSSMRSIENNFRRRHTIKFPTNLTYAVGTATVTPIASSTDGITFTGITGTNSIFSTQGNDIAWNGIRWVAVGSGTNSIAWLTEDGNTWMGIGTSIFTSGNGIAWNGIRWVAVGTGTNSIAYSSDGITWTGIGNFIFTTGNGVAWNGSRWVAVGSGTNSIAYSMDGITWIGVTGTSIFSSGGNDVTWNGTRFVAVGEGTNTIAYSNDGITWIGIGASIFSTAGRGVAWNGIRWVAVGRGTNTIAYSSDGITWIGLGTGTTVFTTAGRGVTWNGTRWVAVGQGTNSHLYSSDGITWTIGATGTTIFQTGTTPGGNRVAWNSALGSVKIQHPTIAVGTGTNTIVYSIDGITWSGLGTSIFSTAGYGVAWNGTRWVAVGSGTNSIAYSSDGITWTGLAVTIFLTQGNSVAWNGTRWVAVGSGTNTIAYSSDGITWTPVTNSTSIFSTAGYGVAWNGIRWVAVGQGTNSIAYSSDGITWTGVTSTSIFSTAGRGVAWNGIRWVAVGQGTNTVAYSSDGITWSGLGVTTPTTPFSTIGRSVAWNGIRWVAVGQGTNSFAYSSDGITWTGIGTSIFSSGGYSVAWNTTRWVAVGDGTSNTTGYSNDGITWFGSGKPISTIGNGIAGNTNVGATIVDSAISLNMNTYPNTNRLDLVSDSYYNNGHTNLSVDINYNSSTITQAVTSAASNLLASVNTTSGTFFDFSIPSGAIRIVIMFNGVASSSSTPIVQIGSGSFANSTTGYYSSLAAVAADGSTSAQQVNYTTGFGTLHVNNATTIRGTMTLTAFSNTIWTSTSLTSYGNNSNVMQTGVSPTLSGKLDRIRITTVNGASSSFNAGSVSVLYDLDKNTTTTALNIAGGAFGSIPYQTEAGTTSLLAYGSSGQVLSSNGGSSAPTWTNLPTGIANPNYLINASFQVAQSATTATITAGTATPTASLGYPVFDSWFCYSVGGNPTLSQVAGSGSTTNRLQLTGAAGVTSVGIGQRIEAINTTALAGKNVTLSFECSNSLLASLTITVNRSTTTVNTFGTIATPTKTQIATTPLTITSTLTRYSYTFTCPAEVNLGLEILFTLGAQTSGTFILSNVKLEEGSVSTQFIAANFSDELSVCKRYFETSYPYGVSVGSSISSLGIGGIALNTLDFYTSYTQTPFSIRKRTTPTMIGYSINGTLGALFNLTTSINQGNIGFRFVSEYGFCILCSNNTMTASNAYAMHYVASSYIP